MLLTSEESKPAPPPIRRTDDLGRAISALTDANDRLVAMCRLVASGPTALDESTTVGQLANDAVTVLHEAAVHVQGPTGLTVALGETALLGQMLDRISSMPAGKDVLHRSDSDHVGDTALRWLGDTGAFLIVGTTPGRRLTTGALQLLDAVAGHGTRMFEVALLHEQSLRQARRMHEHQIAASLTARVLPATLPTCPTAEVAARCEPASIASGDFYVVVEVDGAMVVAVGDVAGKALPAAVMMTMLAVTVQAAARRLGTLSAGDVLAAINTDVYDHFDNAGLFATMALAVWHPDQGVVDVANAGHSPVAVIKRQHAGESSSRTVNVIAPTATPLGVLRDLGTESVTWELEPGDAIFLGSDGIAEQRDPSDEMFGYDALTSLLADHTWADPESLVDAIFERVAEHQQDAATDDDRTALVLMRRPIDREDVS